jgi:alpha-1,2-mannosyltransferase
MPDYGPAFFLGGDLGVRKSRGTAVWQAALISAGVWTLVLALLLDVRFIGVTLERISTNSMTIHGDFDTFWRSAAALWEGRDVYDTGARLTNLNPPFWILLVAPLGLLEPLVAYRVFVLITLVITVGYLAWMADELRLRSRWAVVGAVMLLLSSPLLATLALGQIYPVLAFGLVAAWVADRRGRPSISGGALGLVVALKPSLAPVLLWPLVRRRWRTFGAALASGVAATLVAAVAVGPRATLDWLGRLSDRSPSPYWDNASLPAAAARLFTESEFAQHVAILPWTIPVAYALGIGAIAITAVRAGWSSEAGLWALVAASLLASPIAWHNYLVLLGPGILVLLAQGRTAPAFLLLALQSIPGQWPLLWNEMDTVAASLALTLYLGILIAHWLALLFAVKESVPEPSLEAGKPGSENRFRIE